MPQHSLKSEYYDEEVTDARCPSVHYRNTWLKAKITQGTPLSYRKSQGSDIWSLLYDTAQRT